LKLVEGKRGFTSQTAQLDNLPELPDIFVWRWWKVWRSDDLWNVDTKSVLTYLSSGGNLNPPGCNVLIPLAGNER